MTQTPSPTASPGSTLRGAVWLLYLEAAGVMIAVVVFIVAAATQQAVSVASAITSIAYLAGIAAILGGLALALARRRRWARSPAIVLELLLLPIGYYMIGGGLAWLGVPAMLLGLVCAGLLFAPSTREALGIGWDGRGR